MHSDPRRIAYHQVEAICGGDVGEVRAEGEGKRSAFSQGFDFLSRITQAPTNAFESEACRVIRRMPQSKQVSPPQQHQQLLALGGEANSATRKDIDCCRPLEPVESASQGEFAGPGRSHVSAAKAGQPATARNAAAIVESGTSERISDADVPVEIRQRRDSHWIWLVALDDNRQPQAQLAEPHRHRIEIDAEYRRR